MKEKIDDISTQPRPFLARCFSTTALSAFSVGAFVSASAVTVSARADPKANQLETCRGEESGHQ